MNKVTAGKILRKKMTLGIGNLLSNPVECAQLNLTARLTICKSLLGRAEGCFLLLELPTPHEGRAQSYQGTHGLSQVALSLFPQLSPLPCSHFHLGPAPALSRMENISS